MVYTPRHLRNQDSEIPCQYCGRKTKQSLPFECGNLSPNTYARQHILPRRRGGHSNIENLKDCCKNCNDVLAVLDDCPGALACWRGVAVKLHLPDTASGAKGAHRRTQKQLKIAELNAMDPTALSVALAGKRQNKINRFFVKQKMRKRKIQDMVLLRQLTPEEAAAELAETELAILKFKQTLAEYPDTVDILNKHIELMKQEMNTTNST